MKITRTRIYNSSVKLLERATKAQVDDGLSWYFKANQYCRELSYEHNIPLPKVVGILSALSPQKLWSQNKILAEKFLSGDRTGHTGVCLDKSARILLSLGTDEEILEILNGPKTKAFYLNILYPEKDIALTVDRHMIGIALREPAGDRSVTKRQYERLEDAFRYTADKVGMRAIELQAVLWSVWRESPYV